MADLRVIASQANTLLILTITLLAVSFISVVLRFVVRARRARVSLVDYGMLLAQAFFIATCVFFIKAAGLELVASQSQAELSKDDASLTQTIKIATVLYAFTVNTVKISIGAWLPNTRRWQRIIVNCLLLLSTIVTLAFFAMLLFPCSSVSAKLTNDGVCNPTRLSALFTVIWSFFNAISDVMIACFALVCLVRDNSPRNAKYFAAMVYLLGCLGVIVACARCAILLGVYTNDIEIQRVIMGQCAVLEAGLLIFAGCLATLRPLFGRAMGYVREEQLDYRSAPGNEQLHSEPTTPDLTESPVYDYDDEKDGSLKAEIKHIARQREQNREAFRVQRTRNLQEFTRERSVKRDAVLMKQGVRSAPMTPSSRTGISSFADFARTNGWSKK